MCTLDYSAVEQWLCNQVGQRLAQLQEQGADVAVLGTDNVLAQLGVALQLVGLLDPTNTFGTQECIEDLQHALQHPAGFAVFAYTELAGKPDWLSWQDYHTLVDYYLE